MVCPTQEQAALRITHHAPDGDGDGSPDDIFGNPMRTFIRCERGPTYAGNVPSLRVAVLVVTERPAGDAPHYTAPPGGWLASRTEKIGVGILMDVGGEIRPVSRAGSQVIVDFIDGFNKFAYRDGQIEFEASAKQGEIVAASARLIEGTAPPRRMVPPEGYGIPAYPDSTDNLPPSPAGGTDWPYGLKPGCYKVRHEAETKFVTRACPAGQTGTVEFLQARSRRIRVLRGRARRAPARDLAGRGGRGGGLAVLPGDAPAAGCGGPLRQQSNGRRMPVYAHLDHDRGPGRRVRARRLVHRDQRRGHGHPLLL